MQPPHVKQYVKRLVVLVLSGALAALPGAFVAGLLSAAPVSAAPGAVHGFCTAGIDVDGIQNELDAASTPSRAIQVKAHSSVEVFGYNHSLSSDLGGQRMHYDVQMQFYLFNSRVSWTVASGDTSLNGYSSTVDVDKYARYGTGLYLIHAIAYESGAAPGSPYGPVGSYPCAIDGFVNIVPSGLSDAEIGGIAVGAIGVAAAAAAGLVASQEGRGLSNVDELAEQAAEEDQEKQKEAEQREKGEREFRDWENGVLDAFGRSCAAISVIAVPMTLGALSIELLRALGRHIRGILS